MKLKLLSFLLCCSLLIVIISCSEVVKDEGTIRKWHYENGTLKKVQEYKKEDSIEHGTYLYYYPSGILKDSAQIDNGKFHGDRFEYHENGKLHIQTTYSNNIEREGLVYRKDGSLHFYKAFNYARNLMFVISYDREGEINKVEGELIYSWILEDEYTQGEKFQNELLVATPPHCEVTLSVRRWIEGGKVISEKTFTPDKFNRVIYTSTQNSDSTLLIMNVAEIKDTTRNFSLTDSLLFVIDQDGYTSYQKDIIHN